MKNLSYLLFLLTGFLLSGCQHTSQKHPVRIGTVSFQYRTEDSFKGILEALTHKQSTNGRIFLQTNPEVREGCYFIVSFDGTIKRLPVGSVIRITYITSLEPKEQVAQWTIPAVKYSLWFQNELYLGVTGEKQYTPQTKLIAWKLDLIHPDGHTIATKHSFAW